LPTTSLPQLNKKIVIHPHGFVGGIAGIKNIPCNYEGINALGVNGCQQPIKEQLMVLRTVVLIKFFAQVPIGGMKYAHS
jgi:hypothetical protein